MDLMNNHTPKLGPFSLRTYVGPDTNNQVWWAAICGPDDIQIPKSPVPILWTQGWNNFVAFDNTQQNNGLRLIDIETYAIGGTRFWAGVWVAGDWDSYLEGGDQGSEKDLKTFIKDINAQHKDYGLRLTDAVTYVEQGKHYWAGIGRAGNWANTFIANMTFNAFAQKVKDMHAAGRSLISVAVYDAAASS